MAKTDVTGQYVVFPEKTSGCFSLPLHFTVAELQQVLKTHSSYMSGLFIYLFLFCCLFIYILIFTLNLQVHDTVQAFRVPAWNCSLPQYISLTVEQKLKYSAQSAGGDKLVGKQGRLLIGKYYQKSDVFHSNSSHLFLQTDSIMISYTLCSYILAQKSFLIRSILTSNFWQARRFCFSSVRTLKP